MYPKHHKILTFINFQLICQIFKIQKFKVAFLTRYGDNQNSHLVRRVGYVALRSLARAWSCALIKILQYIVSSKTSIDIFNYVLLQVGRYLSRKGRF